MDVDWLKGGWGVNFLFLLGVFKEDVGIVVLIDWICEWGDFFFGGVFCMMFDFFFIGIWFFVMLFVFFLSMVFKLFIFLVN